jgi:hypothetical protein
MKNKLLAAMFRWTGRILGVLLVVSVVIIAIGEGMPNPFTQPLEVLIGFLALALIIVGTLAGWRWEFFGGVLSLAGWCLFFASVIQLKHLTWFVAVLALPGLLYLLSALLRRHDQRQMP